MNFLITGAAGFLGSALANTLAREGHQVRGLDDLSTGDPQALDPGVHFTRGDVNDRPKLWTLLQEVDCVYHLAARVSVPESVLYPREYNAVNVGGTVSLMEAMRDVGVRRVVLASSGAIYGDQDVHPAGEDHPARPVSPYGVAKLAVERYLFFYHVAYGLDVAALRYAHVYGPRQNPHGEAGVVAIFLDRLLAGQEAVINGDGMQTRDYVYVGDVVAANLAVIGRPGFLTYNVGTGVETTVVDLYRLLAAAAGADRPPRHGAAKAGEQRRSCITAAALERELGVTVGTPLAEGLRATAAWFAARRSAATA